MKITSFAALCAAPLALAGTLDSNLRRDVIGERNDFVLGASEVKQTEQSSGKSQKSNSKDNSNSQGNDNSQISSIQSTETTEVILIWVNPGASAATTTVNSVAATSAVAATAATHTVVVGGTTKVYTPDTIAAAVGDMVIFEFHAQNHTATQSAFTAPCVALGGASKDTGFMPNINGTVNPPPQAAFAVTVATPVWFYCRQTGHCGEGMTFSINPTANKTQADFQALAIQQNGTGTAAPIVASAAAPPPPAATSVVAAPPAAVSVAAPPPPPPAASSVASSGLTTNTSGVVETDGSCSCSVMCGAMGLPNAAVQGRASFGGTGGSIPASAMEITATTNSFAE